MPDTTLALAYDFDGTLTPGYMQDHAFFPTLGIDPAIFWAQVKTIARENDMDEILAYMHLMLKEATYRNTSVTKQTFVDYGHDMTFFNGVDTWFDRINAYAATRNITLKHYIISSGLREMIAGTSIAPHFTQIFASGFMYNRDNIAIWPATAVNYTTKTQYIFRINKGIDNSWDNKSLNAYMPNDRPVPGENIIYFGDGETDIPAMKMTRHIGGTAIAVYDPTRDDIKAAAQDLTTQNRANFALPADYSSGSDIEKTVRAIIDSRA